MSLPSDVPSQNGELAARAAARKYGLERRDQSSGFYDAAHKSNGRKVQIKSALHTRDTGEPGVFRVWREHLRELSQVGGSVAVAVVNPSNPHRKVLKVDKISPDQILSVGEFRQTGQADMKPRHEARIPWPAVVDL